jgi:RNA polymerase sigma-70 factor (ECF subfamily)
MGHLRLVSTAAPVPTPENACVRAFDRELDYIFATLRRLGAASLEVEDLAQEVFIVLQRNWYSIDLTRPLRPYLFGIAFRIVCAHRRRRAREVPFADLDANDDGPGPESALQSKQAMELLLSALEALPLSRRAVVVMHDLDEVPIADIARNLSITRFGAYARLTKGRRELAAAVRRLLRGRTRL